MGNRDKLPWPVEQGDLRVFKLLTQGHACVVGSRTFLAMPRLDNRFLWVMTKSPHLLKCPWSNWHSINCDCCISDEDNPIDGIFTMLQEFVANGKPYHTDRIFIIGGKAIYEHFKDQYDEFYVSEINGTFEGDVFFDKSLLTKFEKRSKLFWTKNYTTWHYNHG
jgi:dihydrofolate reductase